MSVIVPVRDDPRLPACLAALADQTYQSGLVEIIVCDNGSEQPLDSAVAPFDNVVLIREPRGGSYTARNAAAAISTGDVLAFTDADCLPAPDWIANAVAALGSGADIVAGHVAVYARDAVRPHPVEAYELVHAFPQQTYAARGGACVTANMITTREVFDAAGPFRTELHSGADIEWSQRANALGFRTDYRPDVVVQHPARGSYAAMWGKLNRVMAGRHHRDRLDGHEGPVPWPSARALIPPLGAVRRARSHRLVSPRARWAFVVGEFFHRYASAAVALRLAVRDRRPAISDPSVSRRSRRWR